jgi:hypothetical protein
VDPIGITQTGTSAINRATSDPGRALVLEIRLRPPFARPEARRHPRTAAHRRHLGHGFFSAMALIYRNFRFDAPDRGHCSRARLHSPWAFTNASLNGTYSLKLHGLLIPPGTSTSQVPVQVVGFGVETTNGNGNLTGTELNGLR